jgi:hypothetical protein
MCDLPVTLLHCIETMVFTLLIVVLNCLGMYMDYEQIQTSILGTICEQCR